MYLWMVISEERCFWQHTGVVKVSTTRVKLEYLKYLESYSVEGLNLAQQCQRTDRLVFHAHSYWHPHSCLWPFHSLSISLPAHTATQLWHHRGGNKSTHHNQTECSLHFTETNIRNANILQHSPSRFVSLVSEKDLIWGPLVKDR